MNVVFLLLTTAVSAGADAAPAGKPAVAAPAAAAPVAAAPVHAGPLTSGCCGSCGHTSSCCVSDCCDKPSLFDRLRGLFRRNDCCEASCCPAPAPCCQPVIVHQAPCCSAPTCCDSCDKPGFFDRLRGLFRRNDCCAPACDTCSTGCGSGCGVPHGAIITAPAMPPAGGQQPERLKMPKGDDGKGKTNDGKGTSSTAAPSLTPAGAKVETEAKNPFDSGRRHEQRGSRAADYSQLTGQLSFVHADGGLWVLRYAPLSEEDANGGSVILARDRRMDSYREGDLVTVEGRVISQKGSTRLGGPLYQVQTIRLVDRPHR